MQQNQSHACSQQPPASLDHASTVLVRFSILPAAGGT